MSRPRKPLTREKRIEAIETRLRNPEISDKQFSSLNHQLMLLRGEIVPYQRKPKPKTPEPKNEPLTFEQRWERMTPEEREECAAYIHKMHERGKELDAWREANAERFKIEEEKHERHSLLLTLGQSQPADVSETKPAAKPASKPEAEIKPPTLEQLAIFHALDALPDVI